MTRTPILGQIAAILEAAPVAREWLPESYTYRDLARQVYRVDEPTHAQLSAVRRAVAKLVAGGHAERSRGDRRFDPNRTHVRRRRNGELHFVYANPAGTEVRRPLTEAECQTRDKLRAAERARLAAGGSPWPPVANRLHWVPVTNPTGHIAIDLRQARVDAGLTQQALADRVGVVREEVARWEAGGQTPRVETAVRLAQALGTSVEAIWEPLTPELFIERSVWAFAKTMPQNPHEYTLKDPDSKAPAMSPEAFEWFVKLCRETGTKRKFGGRSYIYLEVGEWRYWSMGAPVPKTTLINRARIGEPAQNTHNGGSGQLRPRQLGLDDDQEESRLNVKPRCAGLTKSGRRCKNDAHPGRLFCRGHDPELETSPKWAAARRAHESGALDRLRKEDR